MSSERPLAITDADVRSLAAKLKGLHTLLTPPEQEVLHTLLRRAARGENAGFGGEAEGPVWGVSFNPFAYLDAINFGATEERSTHRRSGTRRAE